MRAALFGVVGLLAGALSLWLLSPRLAASDPQTRRDDPAAQVEGRTVAATQALSAASLRAALREEVRAAIRDEATAARQAPAAKTNSGPTAAQPAAADKPTAPPTHQFEEAHTYLTERLAVGSWTERDRERIRGAMGRMNDDERTQIMRQLIVAANKGELRVDLEDGPLF